MPAPGAIDFINEAWEVDQRCHEEETQKDSQGYSFAFLPIFLFVASIPLLPVFFILYLFFKGGG